VLNITAFEATMGSARSPAVRRKMIEIAIRVGEEQFVDLLDALITRRATLAERYRTAQMDRTDLDFMEMEFADVNAWLVEMAELVMVGVHHWIERETKQLAGGLPGQKLATIREMDAAKVRATFRRAGIDLHLVPGYQQIDTLRLFANSWKHNAGRPSTAFLTAIRLKPIRSELGHLSSGRIERRFRKLFKIRGTDVTCFDITRRMIECAREYLLEVGRATASLA
jgi:hypothetical protein